MTPSPTIEEHLFYQHVGDMIRDARKQRYWTQEELAERIGVTRTSVTNIESGRQHTPLHILLRICRILDLALSELHEELRTHLAPKPRIRLYPVVRP